MASNPLIAQGTINRLIASIGVTSIPALNITASYLGKEAIKMRPEGKVTAQLLTLTGAVQSPEPYLIYTVTINLLKTQGLAAQYKAQMESNAVLGELVVTPDSSTLPVFQLENCAITDAPDMNFNGSSADYNVTITGIYYINSDLWDLA